MKQSFILELKKDPITQLYSLLSATTRMPNGNKASPPKRNLKRSHNQMTKPDQGQDKSSVAEILPPKSKRPAQQSEQSKEVSVNKDESQDQDQKLLDDDLQSQNIEDDIDNQKIDENEVDYPKTSFIIPSCSGWFNIDKVHEIEMQSLPEFFCSKFPHKNPQTYFDYRNYIIKLYREAPNSYLSATVCRKNLPGDVCSIIRLHAFLEQWGLINFNVDPSLKPTKVQLGASGNINQQIIEIASKGYLKLSEAHQIANYFQNKEQNQQHTSPSENLYLIAARKVNILSSYKRPTCNFCGNLCGFYWYKRKPHDSSYHQKEENVLKNVNEADSLHAILKSLTTTYLICVECFNQNNYPNVLEKNDFEKTSLETLLRVDVPNKDGEKKDKHREGEGRMSEEEEDYELDQEWTSEEKEKLIDAVALHNNDWEEISEEIFANKFSASQCALQFLSLPISESLMIKFHNSSNYHKRIQDENFGCEQNAQPSVFQDCSNPLLSQLAILVKSIDFQERQHLADHRIPSQVHSQNNTIESNQAQVIEKRQTRKQSQKKVIKDSQNNQVSSQPGKQSQNDLYLVPPQAKSKPCLSKETIEQIRKKAESNSKRLVKEKRKEIEGMVNQALYAQLAKLEHKMKFLREYWNIFGIEKRDLNLVKEEALAERLALSLIKSGKVKGVPSLEKTLGQNEFALSKELIKEIKE